MTWMCPSDCFLTCDCVVHILSTSQSGFQCSQQHSFSSGLIVLIEIYRWFSRASPIQHVSIQRLYKEAGSDLDKFGRCARIIASPADRSSVRTEPPFLCLATEACKPLDFLASSKLADTYGLTALKVTIGAWLMECTLLIAPNNPATPAKDLQVRSSIQSLERLNSLFTCTSQIQVPQLRNLSRLYQIMTTLGSSGYHFSHQRISFWDLLQPQDCWSLVETR